MKVLVTGGAGFIGSHLAESLLQKGHQVIVLDDFSTGKHGFLNQLKKNPDFTLLSGSVNDREIVDQAMKDCDAIYHMAAVLGVKNTVDNPLKVIESNIDGTRNILEAAYPKGVKVIFASTSEVYGKNPNLPFKEDDDRVLGATSTNRWCYATAKALDEHLCLAYAEKGLPVTIVRYFNTYGPRQTSSEYGGVVSRFIKAALNGDPIQVYGDGSQTRCFTFVRDAVSGTVKALDSNVNGLIFNIGTEYSITIEELAAMIKRLSKSSSPIIKVPYSEAYGPGYEDMKARKPDLTRSKSILGYHPTTSLENGLLETIEWYRQI
ncbi:NAD-dependent epimerase/dehydratase family protein [Bacillus massiliglaciei]|uniref:NAD-dependent epimerase/dehydratase family protein n=1 Tax=Bacillus massiliglaciei TaxID=1816693 RepID=UPI000B2D8347|nr:SDR family NAD(P)-dependent oxidoreductase [Bacillus massiliglaciei]